MVTPAALQTYIKLSEKITAIDDPSIQLNGVLVDFLRELGLLGYSYNNVNVLIINEENKLTNTFFYDPSVTKTDVVNFEIV